MIEATSEASPAMWTPAEARAAIRAGRYARPTPGVAFGWQQANLAVLPAAYADDFADFCARNSAPCPLIERTAPGATSAKVAPGADLRTDVPRYRVFVDGDEVATPNTVTDVWRDDAVAFLLGCSLTFEEAMIAAGVPVRHIEQQRDLPMYVTSRACVPAGVFAGPLVVSMRPIPADLVDTVRQITTPRWWSHGGPVHVGDPGELGIADLDAPDFGDAPRPESGDVPVFWACGVTPQLVLRAANVPWAITHYPGHMLITDLPADSPPPAGVTRREDLEC